MTVGTVIVIPGPPHSQGRPRSTIVNDHVRVYEPKTSRAWKGMAAEVMALHARGRKLEGPLFVSILAVFPLPKSSERKRTMPHREWHVKRADVDNIAKAVLDAANGVLWHDDGQVARLRIDKIVAAQGEEPRVVMEVGRLKPLEE